MKKILSVICGLAVATSLFAASKKGPVTINLWSFTDEIPGMVEKWNASHPDVKVNTTIVATTNGDFTGSVDDLYTLVAEQPETFDPTQYYKKSGNAYVQGEAGDEWAAGTWYTLTEGHAGQHGFVPAPAKADAGKFLNATGNWAQAITPTDNLTLNVVAEFPTS